MRRCDPPDSGAALARRAANFTVLNLFVDDLDAAVDEMTAQGADPEPYEGIDTDDHGMLHAPGHSVAWFTYPAGNTVAIAQRH